MYVIAMVKFEEVTSIKEAERLVGELKNEFCPDRNAKILDAIVHNDKGEGVGRILDAPRFNSN